jgi:hypothetical protein
MALFLALYASLVCLVVAFGLKWDDYKDPSDKRTVLAMALATPFIGVKHIYAAISDYSDDPVFSLLTGNTTVYLLLSVLTEMIAIIIILGFGFTFQPPNVVELKDVDNGEDERSREQVVSQSTTSLAVADIKLGSTLELSTISDSTGVRPVRNRVNFEHFLTDSNSDFELQPVELQPIDCEMGPYRGGYKGGHSASWSPI